MIYTGDGVRVVKCVEMPYLIGAEGTVVCVFPNSKYPIFVELLGKFIGKDRVCRYRFCCDFSKDELEVVSISEEEVRHEINQHPKKSGACRIE